MSSSRGSIKLLLTDHFVFSRKKPARAKNDQLEFKVSSKTENKTEQDREEREPEPGAHHDRRGSESRQVGARCTAPHQQVHRV